MKKILFVISLFGVLIAPQFANAGGTVNVGLGCAAYFDWSSTNASTCTLNNGPIPPQGTDGPHIRNTAQTLPKTAECLNDYGEIDNDTATIVWEDKGSYNPATPLSANCIGGSTQKYSCSGSSCIPDANGPYTNSTCDNMCSAPTNYYRCNGSTCVQDNLNGTFLDSSCSGLCTAPKYGCSGNQCVQVVDGPYTSTDCSGACGTQKYSCNGSSCIANPNGPYTTSNCDNSCTQASLCTITTTPAQGGSPGQPVTLNWSRTNLPASDPNWVLLECGIATTPNQNPPTYNYTSSNGVLSGTLASGPLVTGANLFYGYCRHKYGSGGTPQATSCQVTHNAAPQNPASISGSCPSPGTSAAISWTAVAGATSYSLRVDNTDNPWTGACPATNQGDYCGTVTGTSINLTGIPGASYNAWVHGCNAYGCNAAYTAVAFSCAAPTTLNIGFPAPTLNTTVTHPGNTTLTWNTSGVQAGSCTVKRDFGGGTGWQTVFTADSGSQALNGWAVGSYPFRLDCNNSSGTPVSSSIATLTVVASGPFCGDGICNGSETCSTCADCGACVGDNSVCQSIVTSPERVLVGSSMVGTINMQNTGGTTWTPPTYKLKNTSGISWGVSTTELPGAVAGQPTYGVANFIVNATAPATPGTYPFSWRMEKSGVLFGDTCSVTGGVVVVKPQCDDGIDNDGDEKIDCSDPQCLNPNNTCNRLCDDELNGCGSRLTLTANPPLVRNGGRSILRWDISQGGGNCTLTGPNNFSRTGLNDGEGEEVISQINQRQTYYLTCGGLTTRATISVIKFIEPRPIDTQNNTTSTFGLPVIGLFNRSAYYGGGYFDLSWSASNADYCAASKAWSGMKSASGSEQHYIAADYTKTFTLTCYNFAGQTSVDLVVGRSDEDPGGLGSY